MAWGCARQPRRRPNASRPARLELRLAGRASRGGRLHAQALQRDRLSAIDTVAVDAGIEAPQRRLYLRQLVDVALLLGAADVAETCRVASSS
jgi:hypothetical protein